MGGSAGAASYTNTTPTTNAGPSYTLHSGDTLSNTSSITATGASQSAVLAGSGATSITNSGLIQGTGANGLGIQVVSGGSVGSITNGGTILATNGGPAILVGDTVGPAASIGTLTNAGLIESAGAASAIQVEPGSTIGAIINSSTIAALGSGDAINALGTIGTISNTGLIQSGSGAGIAVASTGSIGAITNAGTITGGAAGILNNGTIGPIANTGTISSIVNNGQILAPSGTAITLGPTGTVTNGITNSASGLIMGSGVAIDNSTGTQPLALTTAGTIIGAIKLGTAGDRLNVTGGAIQGAITGIPNSGDAVNFNPTGVFTTAGSIANVDTINVGTGTLALQQPVTGALAFNVDSGATAILNSSVGAGSFYNAGVVTLGTGHQTITGNYTQAASGALGVTITNGASGALTVTGTATVQGGADAVAAHVPTTDQIGALIGQNITVLSAGTLVVTNPSALTASSDNVALAFNLAEIGNSLVLTGEEPSFSQALANAIAEVDEIFSGANALYPPNANDRDAQRFLAYVLAGLATEGHGQFTQSLVTALESLANSNELVFLEKQLVPNIVTSTNLNFLAASGSFNTGAGNILNHVASLRTQDTGLAAGDEVGRGIEAWVQPFGSFLNQDAKQGFDGYSMSNYGATLGGDTLVTPNLRLGAALTLSNTNVTFGGFTTGSTASIFSAQLGVYGVYYVQNLFFDGLLTFGYNHYDSRTPFVAALAGTRDSDFGGTQFGAKIGAGYDFTLPNHLLITPYVSLQQMHVNFNSYTSTGGYPFNFHVGGQSVDTTQTSVGVQFAYPIKLSTGTLTPAIHTNWYHNFGDNQLTTTYTTADVSTSGAFTLVGPQADRDTFNFGISATMLQNGPWSFSGGYDFDDRASSRQHLFYLQVKYKF